MIDNHDDSHNDLDFNFNLDDDMLASDEDSLLAAAAPATMDAAQTEKKRNMSLFSRIPVTMTLEVASVEISLAELMSISGDSVIELDKLAGEPLDIKVNGILFGKAEVVVLNDKYGLRIIEFNNKNLGDLTL
ncbi:flagellar motor switch protein FliN [Budvicia aquatica]|uniref:Flagellar motor switch protein FliN n=1 Tax=Budvicia aquatica TaxID=82979 RepID=A0A2C6DMK0_9GAMM|nr:flagellar motor switch protein FliN [Budvicia aquatica]MBP9643483.1 flagellar motor switch protein FliN [Budvicia sp.]PHI29562.1 flagellar motor switch protein FliN [Budvicia aquatica]VFS47881.1 Flagellar motor switch protein FliN [Budvicia aquatica]